MYRKLVIITIAALLLSLSMVTSADASGTVTINASGFVGPVGDYLGIDYTLAQSIKPSAGTITQFTFTLVANQGDPVSGIDWIIADDNAGKPGDTLLSGEIEEPTPSAVNTVSGLYGVTVSGDEVVWLVLTTDPNDANVYYNWSTQDASTYADGGRCYSVYGSGTWTCDTQDRAMSITTSDPTPTPTATLTPTVTVTPTLTPTASLTPTMAISYRSTLDSGVAYEIERSATFGEIILMIIQVLTLLVLIVLLILVLVKHGTDTR